MSLSRTENQFEEAGWRNYAIDNCLDGDREMWLAAHRYEDDILLASNRICEHCVDALVPTIYQNIVPFSLNPDHEAHSAHSSQNKFLDLTVELAVGGSIGVDLVNPSEVFPLTGSADALKKQRVPPCIGTYSVVVSRLCQNLQCRRSRWDQLQLTYNQRLRACCLDVCELLQLGYSCSLIRAAWYLSRCRDVGYTIGLRALACLPKQLSDQRQQDFLSKVLHLRLGLEHFYGVRLPDDSYA